MPELYAFINVEEAEKAGIDVCTIHSPYQLWNSKLGKEHYATLVINAEESEEFRRYSDDPRFVKKIVSYGN